MKDNTIYAVGTLALMALSSLVLVLPAPVAGGLFFLGATALVALAAWSWGIVD
jgi:hypothetical protein